MNRTQMLDLRKRPTVGDLKAVLAEFDDTTLLSFWASEELDCGGATELVVGSFFDGSCNLGMS